MAVDALQHVNIHARDLEKSRDFYVRCIGLRVGDRPPIARPGYWLYLGDVPVIHLIAPAAAIPATGSGAVDHVAFHGRDYEGTLATLRAEGATFREAVVARDNTRQLFVHDPDGVKIELNFEPAR